ncbi:MAG: DUF6491 family protein [Caulobacteraceae bacterium]
MRPWSLIPTLIGLPLLAASVSVQAAQPDRPKANQCFYSNQFEAFHPINDHAFYMRVNINDIYRIDLAQSCPELTYPSARLDTVVRGSDLICGPLDWDLRVGQNGEHFSTPCIVSAQTRLTKEEAAAIPPKLRP